ncbi:hypothetical protein [Mycolicibacterium llatzerense]|uniref:hypothetical protein n=1 Tax=Mycolicibacterium llatzerense TaxID=280871 RepID=UPI0021B58504|nr:hypothetical protein [Mycolicibacterium llatzerense]MCT7365932.1 hypothetical protein [Mycolicibacterium llatzerense]
MLTVEYNTTEDRLAAVQEQLGLPPLGEYDLHLIGELADKLDFELRYPVVFATRTKDGSQLQFWCKHCKRKHTHGRHIGSSDADWVPTQDSVMPQWLWKFHLAQLTSCTYVTQSDRFDAIKAGKHAPALGGICTCPTGSGDGHRSSHCVEADTDYYVRGYTLYEVEPGDPRAATNPKGSRRSPS